MFKHVFVAALLVAAPATVFAQSTKSPGETAGSNSGTSAGSSSAATSAPSGNLNNPQAQANQAGQPGLAHSVPSDGSATSIPTPVMNGKSKPTPIPQPAKPPTSHIIH